MPALQAANTGTHATSRFRLRLLFVLAIVWQVLRCANVDAIPEEFHKVLYLVPDDHEEFVTYKVKVASSTVVEKLLDALTSYSEQSLTQAFMGLQQPPSLTMNGQFFEIMTMRELARGNPVPVSTRAFNDLKLDGVSCI